MEFNRDFFARLYFFARRAKMLANKKIPKVLYCPKAAKKTYKISFQCPFNLLHLYLHQDEEHFLLMV